MLHIRVRVFMLCMSRNCLGLNDSPRTRVRTPAKDDNISLRKKVSQKRSFHTTVMDKDLQQQKYKHMNWSYICKTKKETAEQNV